MKATIPILLLALNSAFGTSQYPEIIEFEGKAYTFHSIQAPLESYYTEGKPEIISSVFSTVLYRGYVARWKIKGNELLLEAVTRPKFIQSPDGKSESVEWITLPASDVLGKDAHYPFKAKFFSGKITATGMESRKLEDRPESSPCFHIEKGILKKITYKSWGERPFENPASLIK